MGISFFKKKRFSPFERHFPYAFALKFQRRHRLGNFAWRVEIITCDKIEVIDCELPLCISLVCACGVQGGVQPPPPQVLSTVPSIALKKTLVFHICVACVAGPQFYGGPALQRAGFWRALGRIEGLQESPPFMTTRRSVSER